MLNAIAGFCTWMMRKKSSITVTLRPRGMESETMSFVAWSRMMIPAVRTSETRRGFMSLFCTFNSIYNPVGTSTYVVSSPVSRASLTLSDLTPKDSDW